MPMQRYLVSTRAKLGMILPVFESYSGVRKRERRRDRRAEPREAPRVGPLSRCDQTRGAGYGLAGVANQSQLFTSKVKSAKQASSSASWVGPPVPTLLAQFSGSVPGTD